MALLQTALKIIIFWLSPCYFMRALRVRTKNWNQSELTEISSKPEQCCLDVFSIFFWFSANKTYPETSETKSSVVWHFLSLTKKKRFSFLSRNACFYYLFFFLISLFPVGKYYNSNLTRIIKSKTMLLKQKTQIFIFFFLLRSVAWRQKLLFFFFFFAFYSFRPTKTTTKVFSSFLPFHRNRNNFICLLTFLITIS